MPELIVHGGAGSIAREIREKREPVLCEAADAGYEVLRRGAPALEAIEEAVTHLESHPLFNAGIGSVLTIDGTVEMDAAVMWSDGRCGAVAELKRVEHPIQVARMVMEKTEHVVLCGRGLERFVEAYDLKRVNPVTDRRRTAWRELIDQLREAGYEVDDRPDPKTWEQCRSIVRSFRASSSDQTGGTVGAVARDREGCLAAATSTGGTAYKLPGRVGDTPLPGAGTYACDAGAVSVTGQGEDIIRAGVAREVVGVMERESADRAATTITERADERDVSCGLICVDRNGDIGHAYNTEHMGFEHRS